MSSLFNARRRLAYALFLFAALAPGGCDEPRRDGPVVPGAAYDTAALASLRAEKDDALRAADSPLPPAARASFPGLAYYPPNPALALSVPLERFERAETVRVAATGGDVRVMTRFGRFRFSIGGVECTLTAFKSDPASGELFVPFRDRTNGAATYEVGRYLDLEQHDGDEPYLLDFNRSYNPYCAYNASYTCPIVPLENTLAVAVEAGEKLPPFGGHE